MAASTIIVRYELKPEKLGEHLELVNAVFDYLNANAPSGVHYAAMRNGEGYDFTHIGHFEDDDARAAFAETDVFAAFSAEIADRCVVQPAPAPQTLVGSAAMFG